MSLRSRLAMAVLVFLIHVDIQFPKTVGAGIIREDSFDMEIAAKLWDKEVGCATFRARHKSLIDAYSKGGPETWPRIPHLQNLSSPSCNTLKLRHVVVRFKRAYWMDPDKLVGFYTCSPCGITCQVAWSSAIAYKPDADIYVDLDLELPPKAPGEPLRVILSLEPFSNWTSRDMNADISVGYDAQKDIQVTYARHTENHRQHHLSSIKKQDVPLYYASSHCQHKWRNEIIEPLLQRVPHHSVGKCKNNVGGLSKETSMYPHCRLQRGVVPDDWHEIIHCVMSHYKFSVAFENSRRPGYITEKLFIPLETGTVPIYLGSEDVRNAAPPESFIDGTKFDSIESLADYIIALNNDPVAYMNFFAWRRCGVWGHFVQWLHLSLDSLPCRLCEKISDMG